MVRTLSARPRTTPYARVVAVLVADRAKVDPAVQQAEVEATKRKVRDMLARVRFRRAVKDTIGR
jgi:hypothetical protein